jgi:phasin family protein
MTTFEQFPVAQLSTFFAVGAKALEGAEKFAALNLQTAKRILDEAQETSLAALSSKDPQGAQQFGAVTLTQASEKANAYWHHAYEIASATAGEITKLVEADVNEAKARWFTALDAAVKNAPAETVNVVTLMKTALSGANDAYTGMQKAAKQAADIAETSFEDVAESAVKSSAAAASKSRRVEA